ncbi:MAG: MCE family protein [Citrobacter freundii]|nr:MAG: MCE family protein [Citrobacter freundii]
MPGKITNHIKLGIFLLGGLLFLVTMLYMIGKNQHLFGKTYLLKARFENVGGLVPGNNVRVSGIQAGTVKALKFLSDTVIEVSMLIDSKMKDIVRRNALVSIGTDGLVGNKVVNIVPGRGTAPLAVEGDLLVSKKAVSTEDMLQTLDGTNNDVAVIASQLKTTIERINQSKGVWELINDGSIPASIRLSAYNIQKTTEHAKEFTWQLNHIINDVKNGKGPVGTLLTDSAMEHELKAAVTGIGEAAVQTKLMITHVNSMISQLDRQLNNQQGVVHTLLTDSSITAGFRQSMNNIEKATDGLNQNMEALKHNFLFRGYFRRLEKQQRRSQSK